MFQSPSSCSDVAHIASQFFYRWQLINKVKSLFVFLKFFFPGSGKLQQFKPNLVSAMVKKLPLVKNHMTNQRKVLLLHQSEHHHTVQLAVSHCCALAIPPWQLTRMASPLKCSLWDFVPLCQPPSCSLAL